MDKACQAKAGALGVAVLSRDIVSVWLERASAHAQGS
jgi:hypothetical protein